MVRQIESKFADELVAREEQAQRRHSWKAGDDDPANPFNRQATWGRQSASAELSRPKFTALSRGDSPDEIAYTLATTGVGGLFTQSLAGKEEKRLMHRSSFFASHLDRQPSSGRFAFSRAQSDGSVNLCIRQPEANHEDEVTEGDSVDEAPSWCGDNAEALVYHSCGIGRDARGIIFGYSPSQIERLDLSTGEIETLADSERHDLLCPRTDAAGVLYYIRRPFVDPRKVSHAHALKSALLLPWHVLTALVGFLNAFSMMFGGKPLARSRPGGAGLGPADDLAYHRIWGRAIESRDLLRARKGESIESLVPSSWELVRQTADGQTHVLSSGVAAFDLGADGRIVVSNGVEIALVQDRTRVALHRQMPVETVRILD